AERGRNPRGDSGAKFASVRPRPFMGQNLIAAVAAGQALADARQDASAGPSRPRGIASRRATRCILESGETARVGAGARLSRSSDGHRAWLGRLRAVHHAGARAPGPVPPNAAPGGGGRGGARARARGPAGPAGPRRAAAARRGVELDHPVLQCVIDADLTPIRPRLSGRRTVGYAFFENTAF